MLLSHSDEFGMASEVQGVGEIVQGAKKRGNCVPSPGGRVLGLEMV